MDFFEVVRIVSLLLWPNIVIIISGSLLVLILSVSAFRVMNAELPTGWQFTAVLGRSRFFGHPECDGGRV